MPGTPAPNRQRERDVNIKLPWAIQEGPVFTKPKGERKGGEGEGSKGGRGKGGRESLHCFCTLSINHGYYLSALRFLPSESLLGKRSLRRQWCLAQEY